jgi:hypothetical protein
LAYVEIAEPIFENDLNDKAEPMVEKFMIENCFAPPLLTKFLNDKLLAKDKKSNTETCIVEPRFLKAPKMLQVEPTGTSDLTLILLLIETKSNTLQASPNLPNPRNDKFEPRFANCNILKFE